MRQECDTERSFTKCDIILFSTMCKKETALNSFNEIHGKYWCVLLTAETHLGMEERMVSLRTAQRTSMYEGSSLYYWQYYKCFKIPAYSKSSTFTRNTNGSKRILKLT